MRNIASKPVSRISLTNPVALLLHLWRYRELTIQMTIREVAGRYRSTFLGMIWPIIMPLALLAIYTFTFGIVFKGKWHTVRTGSRLEYAMTLFTGVILFNMFSEAIGRSTAVITTNVNYVKRVVFPLEILPLIQLGAAAVHALLSLAVWLLGMILLVGAPPVTALYFPLIFASICILTLGLSWIVSALGVFIRDINQFIAIVIQILFFGSAVFFSIQDVPENMAWILRLNPIADLMEDCRRTLMWGQAPNWYLLAYTFCIGIPTLQLGYYFFMRSKHAFSDVL